MRELAEERGYDLADCYAYSDSISDLPLLEAVGHPSAVNPDRTLRKVAIERGWPIARVPAPDPAGRRLRDRPAVPVAAAALGVGVGVAIGLAWYGRNRRIRSPRRRDPSLSGRLRAVIASSERLPPSHFRRQAPGDLGRTGVEKREAPKPANCVSGLARPPGTHARPAAGGTLRRHRKDR